MSAEEKTAKIYQWISCGLGALLLAAIPLMATWATARLDVCQDRIKDLESRASDIEKNHMSRAEVQSYVSNHAPYVEDRSFIRQSLVEVKKIGDINTSIVKLNVTMEHLSKTVLELRQLLRNKQKEEQD